MIKVKLKRIKFMLKCSKSLKVGNIMKLFDTDGVRREAGSFLTIMVSVKSTN